MSDACHYEIPASPALDATISETPPPKQGTKNAVKSKRPSKRRKLQDSTRTNASNASGSKNVTLNAARPDPGRVRGRRGYLKFMTEVPLDILYEIFRDLQPIDLLYLSWACKSLNAIVMSKYAKRLWEHAFAKLYETENPPPECPNDLNFAQYTRFLFVSKCMECGISLGNLDSWAMRLRVCRKCLTSERFIPKRSCRDMEECLLGITCKNETYFRRAEYEEFVTCRDAIGYISELKARNYARARGEFAYDAWKGIQIRSRKEETDRLKLKRETAILAKLDELGWKQSDIQALKNREIGHLPGFSIAKELTDREWETLQPQLVKRLKQLILAYRERMQRENLPGRYKSFSDQFGRWYWKQYFDSRLAPHPEDLAVLEPFKSAISKSSERDIEFSLAEIDRVAREWAHSRWAFMVSLLPLELQAAIPIQPNGNPPRDIPMAIILRSESNRSNHRPIFFLDAFVMRVDNRSSHPQHIQEDELATLFRENTYRMPWDWDHPEFSFYPEAHEAMKGILTALGKDPNASTVGRRSGLLTCLRCEQQKRRVGIMMEWKETLLHELTRHKNEKGSTPELKWRLEDVVIDSREPYIT